MLKAGFARLDVTPPLGSPLAGYYRDRYADGVLDPIELVAFAANDGENTVLIITADFIGMWEKWGTKIRSLISKETDVPAQHIFIHCLHQHTSVKIGYNPHLYEDVLPGDFHDSLYYDMLYRKFVDVAKLAISDMCEAQMSVAQKETSEELSFIRRFRMKDGVIKTNPKREDVDKIEKTLGQADNTVRLVRFKRKDAKDIALVNFSTHPDTIGGNKFSADWPGFVRRTTEAHIPNTYCMMINGAEGDTNHENRFAPLPELSGYEFSAHMGRVITDTVIDMWDKTEKKDVDKISGQVVMKYVPTNTYRIEDVSECQRLKQEYLAGADILRNMAERGEVFRVAALYNQSLFQKIPMSVIKMGEVAFVGFGGEPFTQYAADARTVAPEKFVICCCLVNGNAGYLPTKQAFEEGGYESKSSDFTSDMAGIIQGAVEELLNDGEVAL